jgi:hypothetical protein
MFENLATFTVSRLLSKYCRCKKILIRLCYSIRSGIVIMKGVGIVSKNEMELINMIRENDNPEQALMAAAAIILGFLKQHGSSEEQVPVCLQALG